VSVHARVTNGTGRVVKPVAPVLLVRAKVVKISPGGSSKDAAPLLAALAQGAVADGRLRFDTAGAASAQLTTPGHVRLRVAGKIVTVTGSRVGDLHVAAGPGEDPANAGPARYLAA